jgi:hypothetical protein
MTPIQGDWKIDAIGLPAPVPRKIYFDNARKLLVRTLPPPELQAKHISSDFEISGKLDHAAWDGAAFARIDYGIRSGAAYPNLSTGVRVLWSAKFLYIGYSAPFEKLTTFEPPLQRNDGERIGLWDRDTVEAFVGTNPNKPNTYTEFEVAPTGETLDLTVASPEKDFAWSSEFTARVHIDDSAKMWTTEMRIPLGALSNTNPVSGKTVWRLNLYRHSTADNAFLGWAPTATGTAHTPDRYGYLQF